MEYFTYGLSHLNKFASNLILDFPDQRVFIVNGEMGAGKTTLIRAICNYLGTGDNVTSPTFSIVNEYSSPKGVIYHFDFYRIEQESEAYDLGYEEYFYSGNYCFIEWSSKIPNLIPQNSIYIDISVQDNLDRKITVSRKPERKL